MPECCLKDSTDGRNESDVLEESTLVLRQSQGPSNHGSQRLPRLGKESNGAKIQTGTPLRGRLRSGILIDEVRHDQVAMATHALSENFVCQEKNGQIESGRYSGRKQCKSCHSNQHLQHGERIEQRRNSDPLQKWRQQNDHHMRQNGGERKQNRNGRN